MAEDFETLARGWIQDAPVGKWIPTRDIYQELLARAQARNSQLHVKGVLALGKKLAQLAGLDVNGKRLVFQRTANSNGWIVAGGQAKAGQEETVAGVTSGELQQVRELAQKALEAAQAVGAVHAAQGGAETEALKQQVASLRQELDAVKARPAHPAGICEDKTCAGCVKAAQEIASAAYDRGSQDLVQRIDDALVLAGGEPLRERVTLAVQQGMALLRQREQEVVVTNG